MDARMASEGVPPLADDDQPGLGKLDIPPIDYQDIYYYAAPKQAEELKSLDESTPSFSPPMKSSAFRSTSRRCWQRRRRRGFRLGFIATTFREELSRRGSSSVRFPRRSATSNLCSAISDR